MPSEIKFSNPLQWVTHIARSKNRSKSNFRNHTIHKSCKIIKTQLGKMGATESIVTSNIPTQTSGFATVRLQGNSTDVGVSIFFKLNGVQKVIQVDRYVDVNSNLYALAKSVEAIRNLDRWGGVQVMDGVFSGFSALPSPEQVTATAMTYYFDGFVSKEQARPQYLEYCKKMHPDFRKDVPTDVARAEFQEMKRQYEMLK